MTLTWTAELTDHVSAPARAAAASLGLMDAALKSVDKNARALDKALKALGLTLGKSEALFATLEKSAARLEARFIDFDRYGIRPAVSGLQGVALAAQGADRQVAALQRTLQRGLRPPRSPTVTISRSGSSISGVRGPMGVNSVRGIVGLGASAIGGPEAAIAVGIMATTLGVVKGAADEATDAVTGFFEKTIQQSEDRRFKVNTLEVFLGSKKAAESYYSTLLKIADIGPFGREQIVPIASQFLGRGVSPEKTTSLTLALESLAAGSRDPQALLNASTWVTRAMSGSNLTRGGAFSTVGRATGGIVTPERFFKAVADRYGKSYSWALAQFKQTPHTQQELAYRQELVRQGILGVDLDVEKNVPGTHRGQVGARAENQGLSSLTGQMNTFRNQLDALFAMTEDQESPLTQFFGKLTDHLKEGTDVTARFKDVISQTFNGVLEPWLKRYEGENGIKKLHDDLMSLAGGLEAVARPLIQISGILEEIFDIGVKIAQGPVGSILKTLSGYVVPAAEYVTAPLWLSTYGAGKLLGAGAGSPKKGMADGGIQFTPAISKIAENGPEIYLPLDKAPEFIARARGAGGHSISIGDIHVQIDHSGMATEAEAQHVAEVTAGRILTALENVSVNATGGLG